MRVQLFNRAGGLVDTVIIPSQHDVVIWKDRYFVLQSGRYVEGSRAMGEALPYDEKTTARPPIVTMDVRTI